MKSIKKLPKTLKVDKFVDFELDLMKESLKKSGTKCESWKREEVLEKINRRNTKDALVLSNRPPLPCDFLNKFPGHGFFYKFGNGKTEMTKDNAYEDFDSPDNFKKLTKCEVVLADYESIRKDFGLTNLKDKEIDEWLISNSCWVSTGQINRMKRGGDLHELVREDWKECVDEKETKVGFRQRGGGRACTFFVNDEYSWDDKGKIVAKMLDVKGIGTTSMQKVTEVKASGFLSYADALKGYIYERAIRKSLEGESTWGTVVNYAIINIGIRWKSLNPATGIGGDTCNVVLVRAAHSRYSSDEWEPVHYSVVPIDKLQTEQGKRLISALKKAGISSQQTPFTEEPETWNVQCTSGFDLLVDFSHWYFLSTHRSLPAFRMTESTLRTAIRLQGKYGMRVQGALEFAYGSKKKEEAQEVFQENKTQLEKVAKGIGVVGECKPKLSWSWMCELDDSVVMKSLLEYSCEGKEGEVKKISQKQVESWTE